MSKENKTAAEMLRELREGMTDTAGIRKIGYRAKESGNEWAYEQIMKLAKIHASLEEIAALVDAAEKLDELAQSSTWNRCTDDCTPDTCKQMAMRSELDALEEKLREQLKGAGNE